jgi:hypothetical protein
MTATEPVCRAKPIHADPHVPLPEARARLRPTVFGQRNSVHRNLALSTAGQVRSWLNLEACLAIKLSLGARRQRLKLLRLVRKFLP